MKPLTITLSDIPKQAKTLSLGLKGGEVFALNGPLGSGKTTFVKALGKSLKIRNKITSPTFILLQGFDFKLGSKKFALYHLDLYRIKNFKEAKALGLKEFWGQPNTVTFIEWADKIKKHLPSKTIRLEFKHK